MLKQTDFEHVGLVATHCDTRKLNIAIEESKLFDLKPMLCEMYASAFEIVKEVDDYLDCISDDEPPIYLMPDDYDAKFNFVYGGSFGGGCCTNGTHLGFKRVWSYYAYARYLIINAVNDTAGGAVRKTNEFSIPTPYAEIKAISDRYRSMGYLAFEDLTAFLCANRETFTSACGCKRCGRGTKAKGFGNRGKIIRKL